MVDTEILSEIKAKLARENARNYSSYYFSPTSYESTPNKYPALYIIIRQNQEREANSNVLRRYRLFQTSQYPSKADLSPTLIKEEEPKLLDKISKQRELNGENIERYLQSIYYRMKEVVAEDNLKTSYDLKNLSKDRQIMFIRNEIVRLECKQLAESIVQIKEKANGVKANPESKKKLKGKDERSLEYELTFEEAINVLPMTLDYNNTSLLARYQQGILIASPYDASIASTMQFNTQPIIPQAQGGNPGQPLGTIERKGRKRPFEKSPNAEVKPIKQIVNLFDKDIVGREINFDIYGFCHHCKEIKSRSLLVQCNYKKAKMETQLHKGFGPNGTYKGKKLL